MSTKYNLNWMDLMKSGFCPDFENKPPGFCVRQIFVKESNFYNYKIDEPVDYKIYQIQAIFIVFWPLWASVSIKISSAPHYTSPPKIHPIP